MGERKTRDFMSVDAFSQLPFIRPAPTKDKNSGNGIRLFGIEVPHDADRHEEDSSSSTSKDNNRGNNTAGTGDKSSNTANNGPNTGGITGSTLATAKGSTRKFECHYCCRNFPTSQALGGHQNAHKRERQHAKRAHLQSALAAAHHPAAIAESHLYGLVNYHRASPLSASPRFAIGHAFDSHYPSWSSDVAGNNYQPTRFYGGPPGSVSQSINGSQFPRLWRISPVQGRDSQIPLHGVDRSMALPFFGGGGNGIGSGTADAAIAAPSSSLSPSSENGIMYEPKAAGVKDHLSLDLHL